jgi:hypothetical protein
MNAGVLAKLSEWFWDTKIDVAVGESHQDAFYNLPYVNIIPLKGFRPLGKGMEYFKNNDYDLYFQMTQHATWNKAIPLTLTPSLNARNFCIEYQEQSVLIAQRLAGFNLNTDVTGVQSVGVSQDWCDWEVVGDFKELRFRPPVFIPTQEEVQKVMGFVHNNLKGKRLIAIETGFTSNQSWLDFSTVSMIRDHYAGSHEILFVSKDNKFCQKLNGLTRRECVVLLGYCEKFFNTCSGFFVASLSEPIKFPKLENICMITKEMFEIYQLQHLRDDYPNITVAHNLQDLMNFLRNN